jgi:hypothetical protein
MSQAVELQLTKRVLAKASRIVYAGLLMILKHCAFYHRIRPVSCPTLIPVSHACNGAGSARGSGVMFHTRASNTVSQGIGRYDAAVAFNDAVQTESSSSNHQQICSAALVKWARDGVRSSKQPSRQWRSLLECVQ